MPTRRREWVGKGAKRLQVIPAPLFAKPPVAGYVGWFDLSDESTLTLAGSLITTVADKSGNGNNATGTNNPIVARDPTLGRLVAFFCNTAQLDVPTISASDRTASLFVVAMLRTLAANATLVGPGGDGGTQLRVSSTGKLTVNKADVSLIATQDNATVSEGVPFVAGMSMTATDCTLYTNTTSETDSNSTALTAGQIYRIGRSPSLVANSGEIWNGWIGEVIMYDTSLSSGDALATIGYLMSKWGIA